MTILLIISLIGAVILLYSTVWGLGWMSDSFQYVSSAVNFARGAGLSFSVGPGKTAALTHYPPMYPITLSAFEFLGVDPIEGARWLNAVLLGFNVLLVGIGIKVLTRSNIFAWLGAGIFAISPAVLEVHAWLLSEPLYLFFSNLSMLSLAGFIVSRRSERDLRSIPVVLFCLSILSAGAALVTRFVGLSLIAAGFLGVLVSIPRSWGRKLWVAFSWGFGSLIPMLIWSLRNLTLTGSTVDRTLMWNSLTDKNIGMLVNTTLTWWLPASLVNGRERYLALSLLVLLFVVVVLALLFLFWNKIAPNLNLWGLIQEFHPLALLHGLYIVIYLGTILFSRALLEPGMGMSDRMLIPLYMSSLVLLFDLLQILYSRGSSVVRAGVIVLCTYLLLFNIAGAYLSANFLHETGLGVSKRKWHESTVIQTLREMKELPIYSNVPSTVYLWTRGDSNNARDFVLKLEKDQLEESVLVLFHYVGVNDRIQRSTEDLVLVGEDDIASIYLYQP